jgi:hypothetical protein
MTIGNIRRRFDLFLFSSSLLAMLLATSAAAVDGQNEDKSLNYGLHWFKLETGALPDPSCGDQPGHTCMDAVTYNPSTDKWQRSLAAQSGGYYDPEKPTIIYFHGWQPLGNISREGLKWKYNSQVLDQLQPWREAGWNVGIFYWNQFADVLPGVIPGVSQSTFGVTGAQNKIWSSKGTGEMGYKYMTGLTGNYYKDPNAKDLGLPKLSDIHGYPWFNDHNTSRAISAVYFIKGISSTHSSFAAEVDAIKSSLDNGTSCEQMIQEVACNDGSPLCSGNRLDWRELFYSKVCEEPSVGDMAFLNLNEALKDQAEPRVIFAGHSLGHQLATRTATQMWMAHIHSNNTGSQNVGGSLNYNALPKRLELLDPYATNVMARALKEYTWDGNFSSALFSRDRSRRPTRRVYNYVKRLKEMTSNYIGAGGSSFSMPVSYYHSTWLSEVGGASWNPKLGEEVAYQRLYFSYLYNEGNRHNASKDWYLASMGQSAFFPSLTKTDSRLDTQAGLSARSTDAHVLKSMATAPTGGVKYYQRQGEYTWDISDDVFEPIRDFQTFNWPTLWGGHDNEAGVDARLFNNRLYITADNVIDEVWVNGENLTSQLSNAGNWFTADVLENLALTNGNNVIAVKVRDVGGVGGLIAELDYEGGYYATGDAHWKVTNTNPGANWMEVDFDASSWNETTDLGNYGIAPWNYRVSNLRNDTPARWVWSSNNNADDNVWFRFMSRDPGPWRFRLADSASEIRSLATAESVMNSAIQSDLADGTNDGSTVAYVLNFSDSGQQGLYTGTDTNYPNQPGNANTFAILATGTVNVDTADTYTFGFNVDDGARIKLTKNGVETIIVSLDGIQGPTTRLGQIYLEPGIYEIEILAYENGGGASFEVFAARGSHTSWDPNEFELLLPNHDLEKIGQPEEPICYDISTGITVGKTGNSVTHAPYDLTFSDPQGYVGNFFTQMQTYNGGDTAMVQVLSRGTGTAQVKIDEETSRDAETDHTTEVVGNFAFDDEFPLIRDVGNNVIGASFQVNLTSTSQTITVPYEIRNPVAIYFSPDSAEPDATHIRLDDFLSSTSDFRIKTKELHNSDGTSPGAPGWVYMVLIEEGVHYMRNGQVIQAGNTWVHQTTPGAFTTNSFPIAFDNTPIVMSSLRFEKLFEDQALTRQRSVTTSSFQILVQEPEADDQTHTNMKIGWVAISGDSLAVISAPSCR